MSFLTIQRPFTAITLALLGAFPIAARAQQLPPQPAVRPAGMPASAVRISPCVAGMGEHWADPKALPFGPIYGVYHGKIVFDEVMIDRRSFIAGKSWRNILRSLTGYHVDHVDIAFNPHGHEGYPAPHYDIHTYYVAHDVHERFCPNGVPNPEAP